MKQDFLNYAANNQNKNMVNDLMDRSGGESSEGESTDNDEIFDVPEKDDDILMDKQYQWPSSEASSEENENEFFNEPIEKMKKEANKEQKRLETKADKEIEEAEDTPGNQ